MAPRTWLAGALVVFAASATWRSPLAAQPADASVRGGSAGAPYIASRPVALRRAEPATGTQSEPTAAMVASPLEPVSGVLSVPAPSGPAPWWAPVASAVVPGAGQFGLRQQRSVAYAVAEGFLLLQYLTAQRDGDRERNAYRALARDVARRAFGGTAPGTWDYYERLETFLESGAYDRIPGGALDPETDPTTYNGSRWLLARETFWINPNVAPATNSAEYQRALAFYRNSAVPDGFLWSWRDAQNEQDVYVQTIRSANRSYQRAVNVLGVVAVNHLASLIDAYISVRVRRYGGVRVGGANFEGMHVGYVPSAPGTLAPDAGWYAGLRFSTR